MIVMYFFKIKDIKQKNKFKLEIKRQIIKNSFCFGKEIICERVFVGKKPPVETKLIERFNELNNLISENIRRKK